MRLPLASPCRGLTLLLLTVCLTACGLSERGGACLDGSRRCAAAETPPGMRSVRRGYRIGRYQWLRRINRESGVPDVGLQAEWLPIREAL
ncbi:hypothetical protein [Synechococcus sp. CBW1004]|uniref:hypothetical protein n=1 Tax=Synechococcus sp. CBW1004 TaxID=1353136 RepID=UPI0018CCCEA2|nr:hypothetical protein [Synechococcus sp. CBW1004]QPN63077.1 hypothetical protein H8F25_15915 [Synechococcus sp. CBW1004]